MDFFTAILLFQSFSEVLPCQ